MDLPYQVALQDGEVLPGPERIAAEIRFISTLERSLGGVAEVCATYRAWVDASESQADQLDGPTAARAVRWPQAYQAASRAGLQGVHGLQGAHFEVRIVRGHAGG
jgi:hypothetical protein